MRVGPEARETAAEGPVLRVAVHETLRAIEGRGRLYRNLVVALVITALGSVAAAAVLGSWLPLAGLLAIVPETGAYLAADVHAVIVWRRSLLEMQRTRGLDVAELGRTLLLQRHLPQPTVAGMLADLSGPDPALSGIVVATMGLTMSLLLVLGGAWWGSSPLALGGVLLLAVCAALGRRRRGPRVPASSV
jgi:hypothetical protein